MKIILKILKVIREVIVSAVGSLFGLVWSGMSLLATGIVIAAIVAVVGYAYVKPDLDDCRDKAYDILANVKSSDFMKASDTKIYDKDGTLIGLISAGHFTYAPIEDISMNIQNAYISQEDKRFKEHTGVDWISTIRAGLALVKNKGEIHQGGSTITQQVIKNTFLTQEKSFKRKLIEVLLAPEVEKKYSKTQIMEYYCNTNFYGNRCYGVESASNFYFGKSAKNVSIAESCLLAGLSNSPSAYDPIQHPEAAKEKRDEIIANMYKNGFITKDEETTALNEEMTIAAQSEEDGFETYQSSYALSCAAIEIMKDSGFKLRFTYKDKDDYDSYNKLYDAEYSKAINKLRSGGYNIYTSLDSNVQAAVQESVDKWLSDFTETDDTTGKYTLQGAAVVADNATGYIIAIVGGRGTDDQYNRAYLSARQPGSAIKPLLDYAPAFESGKYFPSTIVDDHEIENGPSNAGGGYRGRLPLREAVNRSINTVAWQVLQNIGTEYGLSFLEKMQFRKISYVDNDVDAIAIGGFTNGVRLVDMVKGYQTLANNGMYNDNTCILKITDEDGENVLKTQRTNSTQVYTAASAYLMTSVLKDTINKPYGTGYGLALSNGMPAAGKTGTTNNNKDAWFCGYTPYYTMGVWMGYDTPKSMNGIYGATYSGKIWQEVMNSLNANLEVKGFNIPQNIVQMQVDENGNPIEGTEIEYTGTINDGYELFSTNSAEQYQKEQEKIAEDKIIEKAEKAVADYENFTVSDPGQYDNLETQYTSVVNTIGMIDSASEKTSLFNRVAAKYKALQKEKLDRSAEISLYKAQLQKAEQDKIDAEKKKEDVAYQEKIKSAKIQNIITKIASIESMQYRTDISSETSEIEMALAEISTYQEYTSLTNRFAKAVQRYNSLPDEITYNESKAQKEAEEEASKRDAEKNLQDALRGPGVE